jgi:hypothetical protein
MNNAASKPTLYDDCLAAGLTIDHHESDLYILDSPAARKILVAHERWNASVSTFTSEGKQWIDVPFEYAPFWAAKSK